MEQQQTLNLNHYFSVVTQLAYKANRICKQCAQNPLLKKYEKGVNDPVTDVSNYKIQTIIIKSLRHFFPALSIVGQETVQYTGEINLQLEQITLDNIPENVDLGVAPISQVCVWIDPIDNTKGFIKGTLDCVTILIGLARNQRAQLGIIGVPYKNKGGKCVFEPEILVGSVTNKLALSSIGPHQWNEIKRPSKNNPLRFVISDTRGDTKLVRDMTESFEANLLRFGGAGKKIIQIVLGQADALLYFGPDTCKWDSCAGEAIVKALGGFFYDTNKSEILYKKNESYGNKLGNVCMFGQEFVNVFYQRLHQFQSKL